VKVRAARSLRLVALLLGCLASAAAKEPHEYLDEETAATVTIVGEPLVFANERRDLAAHARDYVTLAAVAIDRNGHVSYLVVGYFWSTVSPHRRADPLPAPTTLALQADDRRIELARSPLSAHDLGLGGAPVHPPPGDATPALFYPTDLATLRFIAAANRLRVLDASEATPAGYALWDDERVALRTFVQHVGGSP
jgi:hypothetical protein